MYVVKLDNLLKNTKLSKKMKFKEKRKEGFHMLKSWKEFRITLKKIWNKNSDPMIYWNKLKQFLKKETKPETKNNFLKDRLMKEFPTTECFKFKKEFDSFYSIIFK